MSLNKILIAMAFAFALTACSKAEEAAPAAADAAAVDAAASAAAAGDATPTEAAPAEAAEQAVRMGRPRRRSTED